MNKVIDTVVCCFCGQMLQVEIPEGASKAQKARAALQACTCYGAECAREEAERIGKAKALVQELFREEGLPSAEAYIPEPPARSLSEMLCDAVELIAAGAIQGITVVIDSKTKAKLSGSAKGRIKVERSDTEKIVREE